MPIDNLKYAFALARAVDLLRKSAEPGEPQKAALRALVSAAQERSATIRYYDAVLTIDNETIATTDPRLVPFAQRLSDQQVVERTFTYNTDQDYKANVVTVDISDALRYDFTGSPASRSFTRAANATKTRDTVVADAGTYVGVVPLTHAAAVGDFTIRGASVYTQLVPSAQTETPIAFVPPYAAAGLPVPGAVLQ